MNAQKRLRGEGYFDVIKYDRIYNKQADKVTWNRCVQFNTIFKNNS